MKRETTIRQHNTQHVDLEKIRQISGNNSITDEQLFIFPKFVIARNKRNHNNTEITSQGQRQAEKGWEGKPILYRDHEQTTANQIGRIYESWVEETGDETVTYGKGYGIKTEDMSDIFARIEGGINREMSCAYDVHLSLCSECDSELDLKSGACPKGHTEFYAKDVQFTPDHVSFVGAPAIEGAGIVHSRQFSQLEEDGRTFREFTSREFVKWYGLATPSATDEEIKALTEKLSARDMARLASISQDRFNEAVPGGGKQVCQATIQDPEESGATQYKTLDQLFAERRINNG